MDSGIPRLSGTATLTVNIINSNDKDPYFTPVTQHLEVYHLFIYQTYLN